MKIYNQFKKNLLIGLGFLIFIYASIVPITIYFGPEEESASSLIKLGISLATFVGIGIVFAFHRMGIGFLAIFLFALLEISIYSSYIEEAIWIWNKRVITISSFSEINYLNEGIVGFRHPYPIYLKDLTESGSFVQSSGLNLSESSCTVMPLKDNSSNISAWIACNDTKKSCNEIWKTEEKEFIRITKQSERAPCIIAAQTIIEKKNLTGFMISEILMPVKNAEATLSHKKFMGIFLLLIFPILWIIYSTLIYKLEYFNILMKSPLDKD